MFNTDLQYMNSTSRRFKDIDIETLSLLLKKISNEIGKNDKKTQVNKCDIVECHTDNTTRHAKLLI